MSGWDSGSAAAWAFPVGGCGAASGGDGAEERRGTGSCRGWAPASGGCGWAPAGRERAAGGGSETRTYLLAIRPISAAAPGLGKGVGRRDRPGAAAAPGAGGEGSGRRGRGGGGGREIRSQGPAAAPGASPLPRRGVPGAAKSGRRRGAPPLPSRPPSAPAQPLADARLAAPGPRAAPAACGPALCCRSAAASAQCLKMAAAVNAVKCHIRMRGSPASREGGAAPRPRREQQPPLPPPQEGPRGGAAAPGPAAASPQPPTPARSPARGALPPLLPSRAQRSFGPPRGRSSPGPLRTEARPGHLRPAARSGDAGLGRAASELGLAWKEAGEGCLCGKRQKSVNKAVPCPDTIVLQEPRAEDRVPTVAETDLRSCAEGEGKGAGEEVTPGRSRLRQSVKGAPRWAALSGAARSSWRWEAWAGGGPGGNCLGLENRAS